MLRSGIFACLLLALALVNVAFAQVVVTNGAYATTTPAVVSGEGAPSVPAINTPFAHVGPEATPQADQTQVTPETANTNNNTSSGPVNLGVAQTGENEFGVGGSDGNVRPLGEIAREMRQQAQTANAKTFTNADIQKMDQSGSPSSSAVPNVSNGNSEWPANNGVITPEPNNPQDQGVTAAPSPNQGSTGISPFAPKSQGQPEIQTPPQANAKPSAERPYEMAQNNPANAGIPQQDDRGADNSSASRLPKTASRLPLLGVLGFFTVSMGLFVRYQRAKEAK